MAQKNCAACDELRNDAPNFVVNGLTNTEIASLKNNTGLSPSNGNDDCTDLNNMNDCLIGNMEDEIEFYDVCDWKDYMKKFVDNGWTLFAAIIAAICGLWSTFADILRRLAKLECIVSKFGEVQNFAVGEDNIRWFNGVTKNTDTSPDLSVPSITGNAYCGYMTGSIVLPSDFATNFPSNDINNHGILLYEYRIKLSDFNLRAIWAGNMQEAGNGDCVHAHITVFTSNSSTAPWGAGDDGYASYSVPEGWAYVQVRLTSYERLPNSGKMTLTGVMPVLMNPNSFDC